MILLDFLSRYGFGVASLVRLLPQLHCAVSQNITTVNLPFVGLVGEHLDGIYSILNSSTDFLFITLPIKALLWGYSDPILDLFNVTFPGIRKNFSNAQDASLFYGHTRMYTGPLA